MPEDKKKEKDTKKREGGTLRKDKSSFIDQINFKYKRMRKKSSQRKNIKLEVSDLWGRSRGGRHPRKIVSGGHDSR